LGILRVLRPGPYVMESSGDVYIMIEDFKKKIKIKKKISLRKNKKTATTTTIK
jgi:hypothetical protein